MRSRFDAGRNRVEIDAERDDAVVALEALRGRFRRLARRREERVDARPQAVAPRSPRRIAETIEEKNVAAVSASVVVRAR